MSESGDSGRKDDVVLLHSPADDGEGIRVIRKREDKIEIGELRPMREGQPIHGELVRLTQREEHASLFDCEVVLPARKPTETPKAIEASSPQAAPDPRQSPPPGLPHKGPARVTTNAYRGGWEAIFGGKRPGSNDTLN